MSEYYGIGPSSDFFAHYGVKGMKWGVRKAIESGNSRALSRHYKRAANKLQRLSARSDRSVIDAAKKYNRKAIVTDTAVGGLASGLATYGLNSHLPPRERAILSLAMGGGMAAANAIGGGITQARLHRMGSSKGHAKQVAKRKEFEKEMRKSFKGTEYAGQINKTKRDIQKNLETMKQQLDPKLKSLKPERRNENPMTKGLSNKQAKQVNKAMGQWVDTFEKQYQKGLSKGMTHEQAERYSNDYIAKNGFKPRNNKNRRR